MISHSSNCLILLIKNKAFVEKLGTSRIKIMDHACGIFFRKFGIFFKVLLIDQNFKIRIG
jgi:hypothetical protein